MNLWILAILAVPVINEVMSNPKGQESGSLSPGDRNEFIEIYNSGDDTLDLSGFKIRDNQEEDTLLAFPDEIKNYFP
ncbi:MAG TPA: lamin tail domain-containing protein, partial [candidate division WOR-3 bacterium]|nr:lamin tail domain-containing protein [candidate division WOR-3 bacterium]